MQGGVCIWLSCLSEADVTWRGCGSLLESDVKLPLLDQPAVPCSRQKSRGHVHCLGSLEAGASLLCLPSQQLERLQDQAGAVLSMQHGPMRLADEKHSRHEVRTDSGGVGHGRGMQRQARAGRFIAHGCLLHQSTCGGMNAWVHAGTGKATSLQNHLGYASGPNANSKLPCSRKP